MLDSRRSAHDSGGEEVLVLLPSPAAAVFGLTIERVREGPLRAVLYIGVGGIAARNAR